MQMRASELKVIKNSWQEERIFEEMESNSLPMII